MFEIDNVIYNDEARIPRNIWDRPKVIFGLDTKQAIYLGTALSIDGMVINLLSEEFLKNVLITIGATKIALYPLAVKLSLCIGITIPLAACAIIKYNYKSFDEILVDYANYSKRKKVYRKLEKVEMQNVIVTKISPISV